MVPIVAVSRVEGLMVPIVVALRVEGLVVSIFVACRNALPIPVQEGLPR